MARLPLSRRERDQGRLSRRGWHRTALTIVVLLVTCGVVVAAADQVPPGDIARRADEARQAQRTDEALGLYREALAAQPQWAEGWFQLGTLLYDRDACEEAAAAFRRSASLEPRIGTTWVMLGLCEFQLGQKPEALKHIQHGRGLGVTADPQFRQVMLFHEGLLLLDAGEFERAQQTLGVLAADGVWTDELAMALGRSVLLAGGEQPTTGSAAERRIIERAGAAERLAAQNKPTEARQAYEQLAAESPKAPNVHYALGRHLASVQQPDAAVAAFEQEIRNDPEHVPARLNIAAIKARTDPRAALDLAEEAVRLNPRIPLGHYLLGSLLLQTPDVERAIAELEIARQAVPSDPGVHYALARAYTRAKRPEEAARARATFKRLTEERQAAARRDANQPSAGAPSPPP